MTPKIFIDGEVGTTGLQIRHRLAGRTDIEVISIDPTQRKDASARSAMINRADVRSCAFPTMRRAKPSAWSPTTRCGSSMRRPPTAPHPDWTYGFPEMTKHQRDAIASAASSPIPAAIRPPLLRCAPADLEANLLSHDWPVSVSAVSGYTGGGRRMIAEFEDETSSEYTQVPCRAYALSCAHKHVPEMKSHTGLEHFPLFTPVGRQLRRMA